MSKLDYIPQGFAEERVWMNNFIKYLKTTSVMVRLKLEINELEALEKEIKEYDAACEVADGPNAGKVDRTDRRTKAENLKKTVRKFVNSRLRYNDLVTDDDRTALGLTIPDTTPTAETKPKQSPTLKPDTSKIRKVTVNIENEDGEIAKPDHVHGTEIVWGFLPDGVEPDFEYMKETIFTTKSHAEVVVGEKDRGRRMGLAGRYENHRGMKGDFGEIIVVHVP
jgi:hypothetical protein